MIAGNVTSYLLYSPIPYKVGNKYTISKDNKTLSFRGVIDKHEFKRFNHFFNKNINNFVVNSSGGDIKQAVLIAEVLSKNGVKVIVDGTCGSACANFFCIWQAKRDKEKLFFYCITVV